MSAHRQDTENSVGQRIVGSLMMWLFHAWILMLSLSVAHDSVDRVPAAGYAACLAALLVIQVAAWQWKTSGPDRK